MRSGQDVSANIAAAIADRQRAISEFHARPSGRAFCRTLSGIADKLLRALLLSARAAEEDPGIAVVATGGYGRRELAPCSDIDITFIPPRGRETESEQIVRALFRLVVDSFSEMDWPVGYAFRLPSDCFGLDSKTRSGLMDARLVAGSKDTFVEFLTEFDASFPVADFLIEKIEERDSMRTQWHDTPRVVEFHLREGSGGLRDAHAAKWLSKALGRRLCGDARDAVQQLLLTRNALHIVAGKKQDVLSRARLGDVAQLLGLGADQLVSLVIGAGEELARMWETAKVGAKNSRFLLSSGVEAVGGDCRVSDEARLDEAIIGVCRAARLGLRIVRGKDVKRGGSNIDLAKTVGWFTRGAMEVRALDRAGLVAELIPELQRCMQLPSNDSLHRFSVGEHTLRVVEALDSMRTSGIGNEAWHEVTNSRPLMLAALLHDVGKIDTAAPHSVTGARISEEVCERLGVSGDEQETVVWLVSNHLMMAHMARTHDLAHPSTYSELLQDCDRADRLAMLYLLTIADTSCVGPGVLTPHMEASIKELYSRARGMIGGETIPDDPALFRSEAERRLRSVTREEVESLLREMPTHYLLATPADLFLLHADYIRRAANGETIVQFQHNVEAHTTDVTICTRDLPEPGLLSRIFGVIYALDVSVHAARAASTQSRDPIALDVITVSYQGNTLPNALCRLLASELQKRLSNLEAIDELLKTHGKDPSRSQTMLTYKFYEGSPGILEVQTPTGRGMPYRVAKLLAGFGWNIHVARIGVYADRAVARFYMELAGGGKLSEKEVEQRLGA